MEEDSNLRSLYEQRFLDLTVTRISRFGLCVDSLCILTEQSENWNNL